ncbi:MAG: hypothetical protein ACFCU2_14015 [Acidimicrobiia bacterium]
MEPVPARPVTALFMGLIVGLCVAVILQQGGVWPLDKLTTFLLPGLLGLIFVMLSRIRRVASTGALALALILLIAPIAYGLTGIGEAAESGQLNGGCTVEALSDLDTTIVTDTSRSNPFDIDPDGGLSWFASSPGPITDHEWEIWVVIGGFEWVIADGGDSNSDMDTSNEGDEPSVRGYVEDLGFRAGDQIRGVYEAGGFIEGQGGGCDGFGFVNIPGGFLGTIAAWVALVLGLIALGIFSMVAFTERFRALPDGQEGVSETSDHVVVGATTDSQNVADRSDSGSSDTGPDHPGGTSGNGDEGSSEHRSD